MTDRLPELDFLLSPVQPLIDQVRACADSKFELFDAPVHVAIVEAEEDGHKVLGLADASGTALAYLDGTRWLFTEAGAARVRTLAPPAEEEDELDEGLCKQMDEVGYSVVQCIRHAWEWFSPSLC